MLRLERETEEVSPHTVPHNCIHFLAAATNAQKIRVLLILAQGLEFLGNYYPKWSRAMCLKDSLERAGVKGAPGVLPSGFAAQFAVMLSNMNLLQHNKLN